MSALSDAFFARLRELGTRHATDPEVFLRVWNSESGLEPRAINRRSGACGLNQMMPRTLRLLGAPEAFEMLPAERQLDWIELLISDGERRNGGPFATAARYYHANFFPRTMTRGASPETIVAARDATDADERAAYAANALLDVDRDGAITLADLDVWLARRSLSARYLEARARLARMGNFMPANPGNGFRKLGASVFAALTFLVVGIAWRTR